MATEVKRRRGTTAQHEGFEGAEAELTVDTDKWTVLVHDDSGSAPTGKELLRQDFSNVTTLKVDTTYSFDGNEVQGEMFWNSDEETVSLVTNGSRLDLGHALEVHVRNDDPEQSTIDKGSVVSAYGTIGNSGRIKVKKFDADEDEAKTIIGITSEDISYGEDGKAIVFGKIRKIDTATPEGGTWNEGDILYASTTAGALTKTAPTAGNVKLPIAYVVTDHQSVGEIFVRITPIDENEFQQYDADLSVIAGLAKTDGNFIVGNGSAWVAESGATARTSLGLGNVENTALSTYTGQGGALDNQYITNGAGYITGYTETDTLADVTGRGASTTDTVTLDKSSVSTGYALIISGSAQESIRFLHTGTTIESTGTFNIDAGASDTENINLNAGHIYLNNNTDVDGNLGVTGNVTGSNLAISNWNTAYGWGDHSLAGYLTSETSHADVVVDGDFTANGLMKRTGAGTYTTITDSSTNWDAAYTYSQVGHLPLTGGTISSDLTISGNLTVSGTTTTVNSTSVTVADNNLTLNAGEAGAGVTASTSGIVVDRGTEADFAFLFVESDDKFKIGTSGNLQTVATRQDDGTAANGGIMYFNNTDKRLDNSSNATLDASGNLTLAGTISASGYNKSNWDTAFGWGNHASAGYLTSYTETDTLSDVTGRGASTTDTVSFDKSSASSGNALRVLGAAGNIDFSYTGRTITFSSVGTITAGANDLTLAGNQVVVDTNLYNDGDATVTGSITAGSIIKDGGTSAQFLKADGSVDSNTYLTSLPTHNHDNLYYRELEINEFLDGTNAISGYNKSNWDTAFGWGNHASAGYLTSYTETDPIFSASAASGITSGDIADWDASYQNSLSGVSFNTGTGVLTVSAIGGSYTADLDGRYLESYTETDPIFSASAASGITSTNISNWNLAYNNHITAVGFNTGTGVLTLTQNDADTITTDLDGRYLELGGGTLTGNLNLSGQLSVGSTGPFPITVNTNTLSGTINNGVAIGFDGGSYSEYGYRFKANGSNYYQVLYSGAAINWKHYTGSAYQTRMSLQNDGDLFIGSTGTSRVFHDGYHPNADTLTTAREINLGGDLTGSAFFDGSSDITISAQVSNNSHTHDDRYLRSDASDTFTGTYLSLNSNGFLRTDNSGYFTAQAGTSGFQFRNNANNATRVAILDAGNVGIGTTSPATKLSIGSENHISPDDTNRILAWYTPNTEINNSAHALTIGFDNNATDHPRNVGLSLFNNSTTNNTFSPALTFGGLSTSGDYMNGAAAIAAQLPANVNDDNFRGGNLLFYTQGTTLGTRGLSEKMRINSSGNVGINYTSPIGQLHVDNNIHNKPTLVVSNYITGGSGFEFQRWQYVATSTSYRLGLFQEVSSGLVKYRFDLVNNGTSYTSNLVLDRGNVGIGTSSPATELDVEGTITSNNLKLQNLASNTSDTTVLTLDQGQNVRVRTLGSNAFNSTSYLPLSGGTMTGNLEISNGSPTIAFETGATHYNWQIGAQENIDAGFEISVGNQDANAGDDTFSPKLVVKQNGNVGIGNTSPSTKLHLTDTSSAFQFTADTGTAGDGRLNIGHFSNGTFIGTYGDDSGSADIIRFGTHSGDERMRIASNGSVGIGTISPSPRLHVEIPTSSDGSRQEIQRWVNTGQNSVSLFAYGGSTDLIQIGAWNSEQNIAIVTENLNSISATTVKGIYIKSGGNVGIGTTSPLAKLHISSNSEEPASTAIQGESKLVISGTDGNMDLLSRDDNSTVANSIGLGRYNITNGNLIHKFGIVHWSNTGSQGSNTGDRLAFSYGTNKDAWGNSELLTIKSNGNVGIGTTDPKELLHIYQQGVSGNYFDEGALQIGGTTNSLGALLTYHSQNSGRTSLTNLNNAGGADATVSLGFGTINTNGRPTNEVLTVTQAGNVGIGTATPSSKLQVNGGAILINDGSGAGGEIRGYDQHHSIYFREGANNETSYYEYGGNLADSDGHKFFTGGLKSNQTLKFQIANDGAYFSGNVGIGTTSPDSNLHVLKGSAGTVTALANSIITAEYNSNGYVSILVPDANESGILFGRPTSNVDGGIIYNNTDTTRGLQFRTSGNNTRMVINSSGNVGIGTDSPDAKLQIGNGTSNSNSTVAVLSADGGNDVLNALSLVNSRTAALGNGTQLSFHNANNYSPTGAVRVIQAGNVAADSSMQFLTYGTVSGTTTFVPRMTIDYKGDVGIGTTSPDEILHINKSGNTTKTRLQIQGGNKGFTLGKTQQDADYAHLRPVNTGQPAVLRIMPKGPDNNAYLEIWSTDLESDSANYARGMFYVDTNNHVYLRGDNAGNDPAGNLYLGTDSVNQALTILNGGNVGIGDTTPSYKLDVNGSGRFANDLYADEDLVVADNIYLSDTNTALLEGGSNSVKIQTDTGFIELGPKNSSYSHIETDRPQFYFNKQLVVNTGIVESYDEDLQLRRAASSTDKLTIKDNEFEFNLAGATQAKIEPNGKFTLITSTTTKPSINSGASGTEVLNIESGDLNINSSHIYLNNNTDVDGDFYCNSELGGGTLAIDAGGTFGGNVGIGTSDPDGQGYSYAEDLVILGGASASDGVGITLRGNGKRYGVIAFGDNSDDNVGEIYYDHTFNNLSFRTNTTVGMRLHADNELIVYGDLNVDGTTTVAEDANASLIVGTIRTSSYTSSDTKLELRGKNLQSGSQYYGDYGQLLFNSTTNYTGSARDFLLTNALETNKFAIIQGTTANVAPTIGAAGALTNGTARFVIDSAGNVGIGTTSPTQKLDVVGQASIGSGAQAIVGTDGTYGGYSGIGFGGNTNGYNRVFGNNGTGDGLFLCAATGRGIYFRINGGSTDNVTINSSGNVGINQTNPTFKLQVEGSTYLNPATGVSLTLGRVSGQPSIEAGGDDGGYLIMDSTGGRAALNWYSSDHVVLANGGGNVGIGTDSPISKLHVIDSQNIAANATGDGQLSVGGNGYTFAVALDAQAAHIYHNSSVRNIEIGTNEGTDLTIHSNGNVSIADGNLIVAAGHGVDFSANQNNSGMTSELLDDYEEGTFTPTIHAGASNIVLASNNYGKYTKIGNVVHCSGRFQATSLTAGSSSTNVELGGLPFTADTPLGTSTGAVAGSIGFAGGFAGEVATMMQIRDGETNAFLYYQNASLTTSNVKGNDLGNTTTIVFQITYHTT